MDTGAQRVNLETRGTESAKCLHYRGMCIVEVKINCMKFSSYGPRELSVVESFLRRGLIIRAYGF